MACLVVAMMISTMFTTVAFAASSSDVAGKLNDLIAVTTSAATSTADATVKIGGVDYKVNTSQVEKAKAKMDAILSTYAKNVNGANYIIIGTVGGSMDNAGSITYNSAKYTIAVYDRTSADTFVAMVNDEINEVVQIGAVDSTKDEISSALDIKADINGASQTLSGLQPFITQILGIICYIAILAMAIFTSFDICYITMPVFRGKMENKASHGGMGTRESKATGERKVALITDDAIQAVEESANSGKKPLVIYLTKRIGSYIAIAIVIYLLMSGNISLIVELALKAVSGLMEQLAKLAA